MQIFTSLALHSIDELMSGVNLKDFSKALKTLLKYLTVFTVDKNHQKSRIFTTLSNLTQPNLT